MNLNQVSKRIRGRPSRQSGSSTSPIRTFIWERREVYLLTIVPVEIMAASMNTAKPRDLALAHSACHVGIVELRWSERKMRNANRIKTGERKGATYVRKPVPRPVMVRPMMNWPPAKESGRVRSSRGERDGEKDPREKDEERKTKRNERLTRPRSSERGTLNEHTNAENVGTAEPEER